MINQENIKLIFGLKLKQLRLDQQLSLTELSKISGISISYLNEIEKGKKHPKPDKIATLAEALDVSYDYLVSLQLNKKLAPIADLLQSNILSELPLEMFGIGPGDLLELLSNAPTKLSAFISTLIEISRGYDMRVEQFYFSVLRSYQELHENYFEGIESAVDHFIKKHGIHKNTSIDSGLLENVLKQEYQYTMSEEGIADNPYLSTLRSVVIPREKPLLMLNKNLNTKQKAFALGREIGYQFMQLHDRPYTSSWVEVNSFEQVLNNFKASYFSSALIIRKEKFIQDFKKFFSHKSWDPEGLIDLMESYNATPEMFLHRMTNLIPKFFGMNQLFFLRFNNKEGANEYQLTKEMHLSGLHNPHGTVLNEHYCRRWVSLTILQELSKLQKDGKYRRPISRAQISKYYDSDKEYLLFAIARPMYPTPHINNSVSIGLLLNEELKKRIKFWNDPKIPVRMVNETCERCSAIDCQERAAEPYILNQQKKTEKMRQVLEKLTKRSS